jgi:phosphatidylglycerol:prolipoprotein diacylglycerol transferase
MLYLGIVLGLYVAMVAARSIGVGPATFLTAMLLLLVIALAGARLWYVVPRWRRYAGEPARVLDVAAGGASMYGGLLLTFPASIVLLPYLALSVGRFWDLASFTMLVGMVVTRVGCLLNGCCAGRPTSSWLGVELADARGARVRRVPMQPIEAVLGLGVLACAALVWRQPHVDGAVFCVAIGGYGAGRFVLEPWRDQQDRVRSVSLQRVVSMGLVAMSLIGFVLVA